MLKALSPSKKSSDFKKRYELKQELGRGSFATVRLAKYKDVKEGGKIPEEVAVKIIEKGMLDDINNVRLEIEIMQMIDHPHVLKLYELYDEPKRMHLVMELATGGELFDRIANRGAYSERDAAQLIKTISDALGYLHARKIVHRDLKPENLLYLTRADDAPIKIADFGLARIISTKDLMKTACGTPGYVAPEILKNHGYDSGAVDMWSTGVILYILLCGFPPFYEEELPRLFDQIMHARYEFLSPWWDDVSPGAKELVKKFLTVDPKKRITPEQVASEPWINGEAKTDKLEKANTELK
eukprot:5062691-Prymnesium_polylepis.1